MNQRQEKLLKNIIQEYIQSAIPVGSKLLAEKYKLQVSPATIRNDMAKLEKEGLIYQPHTSAGRVPTEMAYRYYINKYISADDIKISAKDKDFFSKVLSHFKRQTDELALKAITRTLAELSGLTALLAFEQHHIYYTGLSNLFRQPEFASAELIYNISEVIDHLDEVMDSVFGEIDEVEIKIGRESYFDTRCANILTKVNGMVLGLLGPMRMDYKRNLALVNYSAALLAKYN